MCTEEKIWDEEMGTRVLKSIKGHGLMEEIVGNKKALDSVGLTITLQNKYCCFQVRDMVEVTQ